MPETTTPDAGPSLWWGVALAAAAVVAAVWVWRRGVLRAGGLSPHGLRSADAPWAALPWYLPAAMAMGVFAAAGFGGAVAMALLSSAEVQEQGLRATAVMALAGGLSGIGAGAAAMMVLGRGNRATDVRVSWRDVAPGLGWSVVMFPLVLAAGALAGVAYAWWVGQPPPRLAHQTLRLIVQERGAGWSAGLVVGAVVLAPVAEEMVFRVLLQSALQRLTGSAWGGVLVTTALFVAVHWGPVQEGFAVAAATLAVLSVCMGVAYERTRRAGVPMVMHAMFNLVNVAVAVG